MRFSTLMKHATTHKKNPFVRMEGVQHRVLDLPICPKCDSLTLGDTRKNDPTRGYRTCPVCGWHGQTKRTLRDVFNGETIMKNGELFLR